MKEFIPLVKQIKKEKLTEMRQETTDVCRSKEKIERKIKELSGKKEINSTQIKRVEARINLIASSLKNMQDEVDQIRIVSKALDMERSQTKRNLDKV